MTTEKLTHPYYVFPNGDVVSKRKADHALQLVERLRQGYTTVDLSDDELFHKGEKVDAIWRFRQRYHTTIAEAKLAIECLRKTDVFPEVLTRETNVDNI